jgi:choline transport protein
MFGFASTLLSTWETLTSGLAIALSNGGTAGLFWSYVIAAFGFAFIYASIAELGSM